MSWVYLGLFIPNTIVQMWIVFSIFWSDDPVVNVTGPDANPNHILFFYFIDRMWLVLVGIMPLFFAQIGRKTQAYVKVTFELDAEGWNMEEEEAAEGDSSTAQG